MSDKSSQRDLDLMLGEVRARQDEAEKAVLFIKAQADAIAALKGIKGLGTPSIRFGDVGNECRGKGAIESALHIIATRNQERLRADLRGVLEEIARDGSLVYAKPEGG